MTIREYKMETYDLIIIGAGPAGLAAAIYALERKLATLLVESGQPGGQLVSLYPDKGVYDYPSYPDVKARDLAQKMMAHALGSGVKIETLVAVSAIKQSGNEFVLTAEGKEYHTKSIILATGMGYYQPRHLGVGGEKEWEGRGVYYQKLPDKVIGQRVVVVGGGDTALETAVAAAEKGATVMLVHRSSEFRAAESTVDRAKSLEVQMFLSAQVKEIHGIERLESVEIVKESGMGSILTADVVSICIGVELNRSFLESIGVKVDQQAVVVDRDMQTSVPGIFACGDVTIAAGKYKRITVAVGSAATAVNGVYQFLKHPYWAQR